MPTNPRPNLVTPKKFVPVKVVRPTLAAASAKYAALRPPPPPPVELPEVSTIEPRFDILNFKLDNGRIRYLIPLRAVHLTNRLEVTHLAILRQAGKNLATTCHELKIYTIEKGGFTLVCDIEEMQKPTISLYTGAFIFHDKADAEAEVRKIIARELETLD